MESAEIYRDVVLQTLLYARETWTVYERQAKSINHFHLSCLRQLLKLCGNTRSQIYRGPEEGRDAKRTYSFKGFTAKMDWQCYKNTYQRKFSMVNFRKEIALKLAKRNATKTP